MMCPVCNNQMGQSHFRGKWFCGRHQVGKYAVVIYDDNIVRCYRYGDFLMEINLDKLSEEYIDKMSMLM